MRHITRVVAAAVSACCILVVSLSPVAQAQQGATGNVMDRVQAMRTMQNHLQLLDELITDVEVLEPDTAQQAGYFMFDYARILKQQFPDNSNSRSNVYTKALPDIWNRPDDFGKAAESFRLTAKKFHQLLIVNEDIDAIGQSYKSLKLECLSCHQSFGGPTQ